jgi:hypothetical protein
VAEERFSTQPAAAIRSVEALSNGSQKFPSSPEKKHPVSRPHRQDLGRSGGISAAHARGPFGLGPVLRHRRVIQPHSCLLTIVPNLLPASLDLSAAIPGRAQQRVMKREEIFGSVS